MSVGPRAEKVKTVVVCPDYVKADMRVPAMSTACLALLCAEVAAGGGSLSDGGGRGSGGGDGSGNGGGLGDLSRAPSFEAFVLRSSLNALRADNTRGGGSGGGSAQSSAGAGVSQVLVQLPRS